MYFVMNEKITSDSRWIVVSSVVADDDTIGELADRYPKTIYFEAELVDEETLYHQVRKVTTEAVNRAYGTDDRHALLAELVADKVVLDVPIPWNNVRPSDLGGYR